MDKQSQIIEVIAHKVRLCPTQRLTEAKTHCAPYPASLMLGR
jgi:hypothetical protein